MFVNRGMGKQTGICSYNGVLLSSKKEWTSDMWNDVSGSPNNYAECEQKKITHAL